MSRILITGGSGLIGRALIKKLQGSSHKVSLLSRNSDLKIPDVEVYHWNVAAAEIDTRAVANADIIVHLAGAGIGEKRWSKKRKQEIIHSRVVSAELLFNAVKKSNKKIEAFISSSAIGWYGGLTSDVLMTEDMKAADDFLGETCRLWENSADGFQDAGVRTVKIRTGVVLSAESGALPKMALPVKLGLGSAIGNGKHTVPWIHLDDIVNIYLKAIEDTAMQGVYNGVAPAADTYDFFMCTLSKVLNRPYFMPGVPVFFLKVALGEMAVLATHGSRISAQKIQDSGYEFRIADLTAALTDLYKA